MKRLKNLWILITLVHLTDAFGQNLVMNGGFETRVVPNPCPPPCPMPCPNTTGMISMAAGWSAPTGAYGDYFHTCAGNNTPAGVPNNSRGLMTPPLGGNAYGGFYIYDAMSNHREYLAGTLTTQLTPGKYYFEMYIRTSSKSKIGPTRVGVAFVNSITYTNDPDQWMQLTPQIVDSQIVLYSTGWNRISGSFQANGNEKYFIIGIFQPPSNSLFVDFGTPPQPGDAYAYYYVDSVSLTNCATVSPPLKLLPADTIICGKAPFTVTLNAAFPKVITYYWVPALSPPPPIYPSSIVVNKPGTYAVSLHFPNGYCLSDFADTTHIVQTPYPEISLGSDTFLCNQKPFLLQPEIFNLSELTPVDGGLSSPIIQWYNGLVSDSWYVNTTGNYWVDVSANGCKTRDSIYMKRVSTPIVNLGLDTTICEGIPLTLKSSPDYFIPIKYTWSTSDTTATSHADSPGVYWLEMDNQSCIKRDTIVVYPTPLTKFSMADTAICKGSSVIFDATTPGGISYSWNTKDSVSAIVANTSGLYWVEAVNGPCRFRDTVLLNVKPNPVVDIGNDTTICENSQLILDAGLQDSATYEWNKGLTTRYLTATSQGFYQVAVTRNGCITSDSLIINTTAPPPLDLGKDTLMCEGKVLTLIAYSEGSSYFWQDSSQKESYSVTEPGIYSVKLSKGICTIVDSIDVSFVNRPAFSLGPDSSYCFNDPVMLDASSSNADGYIWKNASTAPTYEATSPGLYWVDLKKSICAFRYYVSLSQNPVPSVELGADRNFCKESSVTLDAGNSGTIYEWNDLSTSRKLTTKNPGKYIVKVTNAGGCYSRDSIVIDTFTSPVVDLGKDSFVCEGMKRLLAPKDIYASYLWGDGSKTPVYYAVKAGMYTLDVVDFNGCYGQGSVALEMKSKPVIGLDEKILACDPDFDLKPTEGLIAYEWHRAGGSTENDSTSSTYRVRDYGTYTVKVTDANYCVNETSVYVSADCRTLMFVPTAFTPNGDGVNDIFMAKGLNITNYNMQVLDRLGRKMFATEDINKGWDGTFNSEFMLNDVFFYIITYKNIQGEDEILTGNVTLLK